MDAVDAVGAVGAVDAGRTAYAMDVMVDAVDVMVDVMLIVAAIDWYMVKVVLWLDYYIRII